MERDKPIQDPSITGEPPTLSGYRDFTARVDAGDRTVTQEATKQWMAHWFKPKPSIVQYQDLRNREQQLSAHRAGERHGKGDVDVFLNAHPGVPLDKIKDPTEKQQVETFLKTCYSTWNRTRETLNEKQNAKFEQDIEKGIAARQSQADNTQTRDQSAFHARCAVVSQYCIQHEDNNAGLDTPLQALERRFDPVQSLLDQQYQMLASREGHDRDSGDLER